MEALLCFIFHMWVGIATTLPFVLDDCSDQSICYVIGEWEFKCGGACCR